VKGKLIKTLVWCTFFKYHEHGERIIQRVAVFMQFLAVDLCIVVQPADMRLANHRWDKGHRSTIC